MFDFCEKIVNGSTVLTNVAIKISTSYYPRKKDLDLKLLIWLQPVGYWLGTDL